MKLTKAIKVLFTLLKVMFGAYSETKCLGGGGVDQRKITKQSKQKKKTGIRGSNLCLPLVRFYHRLSYLTGQL